MLESEVDMIKIIEEDEWMMEVLKAAASINLPDWWICAGFVRSKIWDTLHGFSKRTEVPDVDVIYFDNTTMDELVEKTVEAELRKSTPDVPWSVKNEARMHIANGIPPYSSSVDAISKFPETATALGVKLDKDENVIFTAPCGIDDVINMEVKPTDFFNESEERAAIYEERLRKKDWKSIWYKLNIHHI